MPKTELKSKPERLQLFAELACYSPEGWTVLADPTDPSNQMRADKWLRTQLGFLGRQDREDLKEVWYKVIKDARDTRMLFSAVKVLQEKYANQLDY